MDALNVLGFVIGVAGTLVGVIGVILTIYYAKKAVRSQEQVKRLEGLRKRLDWTEIQTAASDLAQSLTAKGVMPSAFVTPGLNGATFANLLRDALGSSAPVYVGVSHWKEDDPKDGTLIEEDAAAYVSLETSKWRVFLPRVPSAVAGGTVLLVDDLVMSGDFLVSARAQLLKSGISNVTTAAIVTTEVASRGKKAPEHSWLTTNETEFYFPWGRSR
jgi:hypoxanthine phosphoribosyltransferase